MKTKLTVLFLLATLLLLPINALGITIEPVLGSTKLLDPRPGQVIADFKVTLEKPKQLSALQTLTVMTFDRPISALGNFTAHFQTTSWVQVVERLPISPTGDAKRGRLILDSLNVKLPAGVSYILITVEKLEPGFTTGDSITTVIEDSLFEDDGFKNPETVMGIVTTATLRGFIPKLRALIEARGEFKGRMVIESIGLPKQWYELQSSTELFRWTTETRWRSEDGNIRIALEKPALGYKFFRLIPVPPTNGQLPSP